MKKVLIFLSALILGLAFVGPTVSFGAAPYYEGKTIRLIVGTSPGGGFDSYVRFLS